MLHNHFKVGRFLIFIAFLISGISVFAAENPLKSMRMRHSDIGKLMDKLYYDAGTKVDIATFDLRELKRQGNKNVSSLLRDVESKNCEMRNKWIELDNRRAAIFADILSTPLLPGKHMLTIKVADDKQGYLRILWAELEWADGVAVKLNPENFRIGAIRRNKKVLIILSKMSLLNTASASFDIPENAKSADGSIKLTIFAAGYPSITKKSDICVLIDDTTVFKGLSPFHSRNSRPFKMEWKVSEKDFKKCYLPTKIWKEMPARFDKLEKDINHFGAWSATVADKIDKETAELRKGLTYKAKNYSKNWWEKHFIRGMCFNSDMYNHTKTKGPGFEPWYYHNFEYITKAFYDADINLLYSYNYFESQEKFLNDLDKLGIPYFQCAWDRFSPSGKRKGVDEGKWSKPTFAIDRYNGDYGRKGKWAINAIKNFGYAEQRIQDALILAKKYSGGKTSFRGIGIDEPVIVDDSANTRGRKYPAVSNVASYNSVKKAFSKHLDSRKSYLEKAGIAVPAASKPLTVVKSMSDLPLWMEWQIFKKEYMGNSYKELSDRLRENGYIDLPVIMSHAFNTPQKSSYVSMASKLPVIATDLYGNAGVGEAMSMQLLHHAAKGQAYMVTGAGYSCKTPARLRRTMATSMIHSDGNIQWTYDYVSKYRNPFTFRKGGAKRNFTPDDRGRHSIENWKPEYWDVQIEMLGKMKKADKWLHAADSVANVAIFVTERLGIAMTAGRKFFPNFPRRSYELGVLYPWMLRRNRPLDICFTETATPRDLKKYKVIILHNEQVMTPDQIKRIADWVKEGGTLIATGETSLYDEWARLRKDFAMTKLFGLHYLETKKGGAKNFTMKKDGRSVKYASNRAYVKVEPNKNSDVLATWNTGDPAIIAHKSGKGTVYYLSLKSIMWITGELVELDKFLRDLVNKYAPKDPVSIFNAPPELEVQIKKKGNNYVVHLLDWSNKERTIDNLKLKVNIKGKWKLNNIFHKNNKKKLLKKGIVIPLPSFKQYDVLVLEQS